MSIAKFFLIIFCILPSMSFCSQDEVSASLEKNFPTSIECRSIINEKPKDTIWKKGAKHLAFLGTVYGLDRMLIFLHELGHAIPIWLLGGNIKYINVSPKFLGGGVTAYTAINSPYRNAIILLAGPLLGLLSCYLYYSEISKLQEKFDKEKKDDIPWYQWTALKIICMYNGYKNLYSLCPQQNKPDNPFYVSDGTQFIEAFNQLRGQK